ncbi:MAG: pseudaminic acid synthase [Desulfobacterales bacterium]|nr:pseudaminic acid synthase [Desulfobacterales bacterium]
MSANHNHDFEQAVKILHEAKKTGADAVKLQTYTADTLTIDCNNKYFKIKGSAWNNENLYQLYRKAHTPWEWHPKLKLIADDIGIDLFSSPFDHSAVEFLKKIDIPAYKVASFEIVDLPLIKKIAQTGKPIIISTGMASLSEIEEAVQAARNANASQIALLKCTSAYPAPPEDINLKTIPHLSEAFHLPVGLSDHTLKTAVSVSAVSIGACIIEKHLTLSRSFSGPDSSFSLEPHEFKSMVDDIRMVEKAIGTVHYGVGSSIEAQSRMFRRSLFAVQDIKKGDFFTSKNIRSIRPAYGLHPRYIDTVSGSRANQNISCGTPLKWEMISHDDIN